MSFVLLKIVGAVMPLRVDSEAEHLGMDLSQHGEEAYVHAGGGTSTLPLGIATVQQGASANLHALSKAS